MEQIMKQEGKGNLRIYVYPGSFGPITNGHMDIIERALRICDKLIVAVGINESKKQFFNIDERLNLLKCALKDKPDIEIESYNGLLVDFAKKKDATAIIRGLRAVSDFENELQMALINKSLNPDLEILFMMTNINYLYLSSSAVKEIAKNGGAIDGLVPECIKDEVMKKLNSSKNN
jgi:pantetheine-phosphate adenylyltransferase